MSRSNTTENARNPSTRWFEWHGSKGHINYWDKEAKKRITVNLPFTFLLLDELATVRGFHQASDSGITANEVRDTRQDALVVRSFEGGDIASGFYASIRDRVVAQGGYFQASCYIAYKDGEDLKIGNLGINGAALSEWSEFKKSCPDKADNTGKRVRGFYVDAVVIHGFEERKHGATDYRVPKFALKAVTPETNASAILLDAELQAFFADYLSRTRSGQTATPVPTPAPATAAPASQWSAMQAPPVDEEPPLREPDGFEDQDIPF